MFNKFLGFLGMLAIVGGMVFMLAPPGHIPPFDANRTRLVETIPEAQCAAQMFLESQGYGYANEEPMKECLDGESGEPAMPDVPRTWCATIAPNFDMTTPECVEILEGRELWPTYKGGLTNRWNKRFPYPGGTLKPSDGRAGSRDQADREEAPFDAR